MTSIPRGQHVCGSPLGRQRRRAIIEIRSDAEEQKFRPNSSLAPPAACRLQKAGVGSVSGVELKTPGIVRVH